MRPLTTSGPPPLSITPPPLQPPEAKGRSLNTWWQIRKLIKALHNHRTFRQMDLGRIDGVVESLISIGAPAVKPLVKALKHRNLTVRYASAETLARMGDLRGFDALKLALCDSDEYRREHPALVLAELGDASGIDELIKFFRYSWNMSHPMNNEELLSVVGKIWDPRLFKTFFELMTGHRRELNAIAPIEHWLECFPGEPSNADLQEIAKLGSGDSKPCYNSCGFRTHTQTISFSKLKQLARQELIRRGIETQESCNESNEGDACPKCGKPLGAGVTRCWSSGCGYVVAKEAEKGNTA